MLAAWDQVIFAALLASLLSLIFLLVVRVWWRGLSVVNVAGLTLCAGFGLSLWFFIFNTFSLGALDFDFPVPLFPVSPEDLSCLVVTGLTAGIYWLVITRLSLQRKELAIADGINTSQQLAGVVWLLPALAALIVDVYFI